jgi:hypothetical protein
MWKESRPSVKGVRKKEPVYGACEVFRIRQKEDGVLKKFDVRQKTVNQGKVC